MNVSLEVPEAVLERLIASGALCVEEISCSQQAERLCLTAICKRSCVKALSREANNLGETNSLAKPTALCRKDSR